MAGIEDRLKSMAREAIGTRRKIREKGHGVGKEMCCGEIGRELERGSGDWL